MKHILICAGVAIICGTVIALTASAIKGEDDYDKVCFNNNEPYVGSNSEYSPYEKLDHDWECKYIVEDQYHGFVKYHYLDEYEELVDRSIQFIGNDGTVYRIPYPYYTIHENKQTV